MILFKGYLYEESFKYDANLAKYSELIRGLIYQSLQDKILKSNKKYLISDLAKQYGDQIPSELTGIGISFANTEDYFYNNGNNTIILPDRILKSGMTKKDAIGISHEIEHHFQFKNGSYSDEGTYTNQENNNSDFSYNNDSNEINARLSQISSFIKNSKKFRDEISDYDFTPFVEEILTKILYVNNPTGYLDDTLSEDNRNKILEYLYLMWKKLKNN